jgi:hypothetical protein
VTWPEFCHVIERLRDADTPWSGQIELVREGYQPQLERLYDYAAARAADLDQLEQIAAGLPHPRALFDRADIGPAHCRRR